MFWSLGTPFVKKNMHILNRTWGGGKLYPVQPLLCGVTLPLQNFTYTLGLFEAPINFQTRCKCVWKDHDAWFMVISYWPYSHSRHCPLASRHGCKDAELLCVCFRGCTSYKSMESDKLLSLHRFLIDHQLKRQWIAKNLRGNRAISKGKK